MEGQWKGRGPKIGQNVTRGKTALVQTHRLRVLREEGGCGRKKKGKKKVQRKIGAKIDLFFRGGAGQILKSPKPAPSPKVRDWAFWVQKI